MAETQPRDHIAVTASPAARSHETKARRRRRLVNSQLTDQLTDAVASDAAPAVEIAVLREAAAARHATH